MNDLALFELKTDISVGNITTNAALLLETVKQGVEKYHDPSYIPTEQVAKNDRAALNRAEKIVAEKARDIKNMWNAPLESFNEIVAQIRTTIKDASGVVDGAVKDYEEKQKEARREEIQAYFNTKGFSLVPLNMFFNHRWLNKTCKMPEVKKEIDDTIASIYSNIKILENIAEHGEIAKALYLDTLDMGAAMRKADALKANAERLASEKIERNKRELAEQVARNATEEQQEKVATSKDEQIKSLVDEALDIAPETVETPNEPEKLEFTLKFFGTYEQLSALKRYMTANNIAYEKL